MDIGQAFSLRHVGVLTDAAIVEKPTADSSVWVVGFSVSKPLPSHLSRWLETSRGTQKIFKGVQAALNDLKSIGITKATVQLSSADSFRHNRFEYLYPWIRSLYEQGCDEERILEAFAINPATRLQRNDAKAEELAKIIIRHAIGQSDGKALEAYLPPVDVLDVRFMTSTDEGHLCAATCPDSQDDFKFLVGSEVPEKELKYVIAEHKAAICKFVLVAAHRRYPQAYTDPATPNKPKTAAFRLTREDIDYLRELSPGGESMFKA